MEEQARQALPSLVEAVELTLNPTTSPEQRKLAYETCEKSSLPVKKFCKRSDEKCSHFKLAMSHIVWQGGHSAMFFEDVGRLLLQVSSSRTHRRCARSAACCWRRVTSRASCAISGCSCWNILFGSNGTWHDKLEVWSIFSQSRQIFCRK